MSLYRHAALMMLPFSIAYAAEKPQDQQQEIETIVVIGEKSQRSLKETNSSVSVMDYDNLRNMQKFSLHDSVSAIPNVIAISGTVPDIRGIKGNGAAGGFNSVSGGAKARVTTLIDGIAEPFVADFTGDSGIWDIEQIEVFRGPQSSNNGRNSIGGSIYIKTADPSFDWEGAGRIGYRNQEGYLDTALMLSGPVIDNTLAFRITAQHLDAKTISDDTKFDSHPADFDLNKIKSSRIKGKLLWAVNDDIKVLLTHSSNNERGDTGRTYFTASNPWKFEKVIIRDIETDSDTTSLKFDAAINDNSSVDILLASMDYKWGFDSYEPNPAREQQLSFDEKNLTLDTKLNLGNNNETVNGFIGLGYFEREQDILNQGAFAYFGDDKYESLSAYGEMDYALSQQLTVTLGARWEKESQIRNFNLGAISAKLDNSKTIFLPKLAFQYDISKNTSIGLSARRGYNAGGGALNFRAGEYYYFDAEKVNSYEISLRNSSEDGRLTLNSNLFYNEYDGYQAQNSERFIVNIDDVITYGMELETNCIVTKSIELSGGLGLLKTDIKSAGSRFNDVTGNELNSAPDTTANLGIKYRPINTLTIALSANYISKYFGDIENTKERRAGNYTIANFQTNYELNKWLLSAYVNNMFNKRAFTAQEPPGRSYPAGYVAIVNPRSIGASVTYSF